MEPGIDPNEKTEKRGDDTAPKISPDEAWGEKQNPVRETATPFTGLREGGAGSTSGG